MQLINGWMTLGAQRMERMFNFVPKVQKPREREVLLLPHLALRVDFPVKLSNKRSIVNNLDLCLLN